MTHDPQSTGMIRMRAEVTCASCEETRMGLGPLLRDAEAELYEGGWIKVEGRWRCPGCWNEDALTPAQKAWVRRRRRFGAKGHDTDYAPIASWIGEAFKARGRT